MIKIVNIQQSSQPILQRNRRGRPPLSPWIRAKIVQIRASNPSRPPSLDRILDQLQQEKWDPLPSRGSVQNIVRTWEDLCPKVRERDLPFEWPRLEHARVPWEGASWVFKCLREYQVTLIAGGQNLEEIGEDPLPALRGATPFTNRWATWCWRVHQAAPDVEVYTVLGIAVEHALAEQFRDLKLEYPSLSLAAWQGFFSLRPDRPDQDAVNDYREGVRLGVVAPFQSFHDLVDAWRLKPDLGMSADVTYISILRARSWAEGATEEPSQREDVSDH